MKGGGEGRVRRDEKRAPLEGHLRGRPARRRKSSPSRINFPGSAVRSKSAPRGLWVRDRLFLVPVSFTLTGKMADEFRRYSTF